MTDEEAHVSMNKLDAWAMRQIEETESPPPWGTYEYLKLRDAIGRIRRNLRGVTVRAAD